MKYLQLVFVSNLVLFSYSIVNISSIRCNFQDGYCHWSSPDEKYGLYTYNWIRVQGSSHKPNQDHTYGNASGTIKFCSTNMFY